MAFTYDAGLRIRPPEPMPDCMEGESAQDYFSRVLAQSAIESATTAENASGDSAPTPFNIGQVQSDVAQLQADVVELEDTVADHTTKINNFTDGYVTGVESFSTGATSVTPVFPSAGIWRICGIVPLEQELTGLFVTNISESSFKINFGAVAANGSLHWAAKKES